MRLRNEIETAFVDPKLLAKTYTKAAQILMDNYEKYYQDLVIKETMILSTRGGEFIYDESEILVDHVIMFRDSLKMLIEDFIIGNSELVHDLGGVKQATIYDVAAKMLVLNDACEKFIQLETSENAVLNEAA